MSEGQLHIDLRGEFKGESQARMTLRKISWGIRQVHYAIARWSCFPGDLVRMNPTLLRRLK